MTYCRRFALINYYEQAAGFLLDLGLTDVMSGWLETWDWLLVSNVCPQEWSEDCPATVKFCFNRKHYRNKKSTINNYQQDKTKW